MIAVAVVAGYAIGSLPTAGWIARAVGLDLRRQGSGNPGANNARKLGGARVAVAVLVVEIAKGAIAVIGGAMIAGPTGAAIGGLSALAGNIYNVWYRFEGGQGLGITAGILVAAWPMWLLAVLPVIGGVTALTGRTAKAAVAALATILLGAGLEWSLDLPSAWGIDHPDTLLLAVGLVVLIAPRQIVKLTTSDDPTPPGLDDQRHGPMVQ